LAAEVGLSPFPRGYLLDMASPTKAVEYMALSLPVVANDNPDQQQIIAESGAGLCVPLTPEAFAEATLTLLSDCDMRASMSTLGKLYVTQCRGYSQLAESLAKEYQYRL
jgi:glycosyltransferase involved in cell wall biosynthesis